mmetsp:Transcript_2888/g.7941  ORF Transcript_2888/g.7941 Transcript_2888/m.7941 type:complete len:179 (+) Transcript_2888:51-587(+)
MISVLGRSQLSKNLATMRHRVTYYTPHIFFWNDTKQLCHYGSTQMLGSARERTFRQSKLRTDISHRLKRFYSRSNTMLKSSDISSVENMIRNNKVVVFSKSFCPYCSATKNLFKSMDEDFEVLELDQMGGEGVKIQSILFEITNQKSVPNVFVNGQHLGGNDDTQAAARNGTLRKMLE